MNTKQEKGHNRRITPTLIRFKRKNQNSSIEKNAQLDIDKNQRKITDRSSSKASRCSFEAHDKKILNLSRLRNHLKFKNEQLQNSHRKTQFTAQTLLKHIQKTRQRSASNERENLTFIGSQDKKIQNCIKLTSKKNSSSGKTLPLQLQSPQRRRSNSKRNQQSLQKQQERAKLGNTQLLANLMKKQPFTPNYLQKIKNRQPIVDKRKKKFLRLNVQIKSHEELENYQILGQLGKGAYGIVKMGIDKRIDQKVAIKIYEKRRLDEPNKIHNLERQINILAALDHPVIAKLITSIQTANQIYLVLQYGGANSLYNYLLSKPQHRLPQSQAKTFFKTIAETIKYLHDKNIVHRDIKAQNILINRRRQIKLIDFGFSLENHPENMIDTFCGTPTYMAPEIVSKTDHYPIYTDMWSLGIILYVFLQGNYPFRAKNENQLFQKIRKGHFEYIHNDISVEGKKMIESLIKVNPYERLTINEVLQNKDWFNQIK